MDVQLCQELDTLWTLERVHRPMVTSPAQGLEDIGLESDGLHGDVPLMLSTQSPGCHTPQEQEGIDKQLLTMCNCVCSQEVKVPGHQGSSVPGSHRGTCSVPVLPLEDAF